MVSRKIISIDDELCTGCGNCIPNCPEGALQLIDGKARLISDLFCDGLGACIGECPEGAIAVEEREAEPYDERRVMANIVKQGENVILAHLEHLKHHSQHEYLKEAVDYLKEKRMRVPDAFQSKPKTHHHGALPCGCPGSAVRDLREEAEVCVEEPMEIRTAKSELRQWPVQIMLVPPIAPYLKNADLLIAADCVPFAYPDFHERILKGRILLVGCPKLDDVELYRQKFLDIFKSNNIKSVTIAHMEVPCCFGLGKLVSDAIKESGKNIKMKDITIGVKGEILNEC